MTATKATCSLSQHDSSTDELQKHREEETKAMIEYTLGMIKERHPEWTKNDPTCQRCWDYYKNLPAS